jgi:putative transposase
MSTTLPRSPRRKRYQTDLTDAQWAHLEPLVSAGHNAQHHRRVHRLREIVNALLYQLRTGCAWEHLPEGFPPKGTVYDYFRRWRQDGTFVRLHDALREQLRRQEGRPSQPSAAIIDTQTVKTSERGGALARLATIPVND